LRPPPGRGLEKPTPWPGFAVKLDHDQTIYRPFAGSVGPAAGPASPGPAPGHAFHHAQPHPGMCPGVGRFLEWRPDQQLGWPICGANPHHGHGPQLGRRRAAPGRGGLGLCPGGLGQCQPFPGLCLCHQLPAFPHRGRGPERGEERALHPLWPGEDHALPHVAGQHHGQQPTLFRPDPHPGAGLDKL
jgi:hypothetical protein